MSTSEIGGRASRSDATPRGVSHTSGWVTGLAVFAGAMMILGGIFQMMAGLVALFENKVYVAGARYLFAFDLTTWGWIHLLLGALVTAAGVRVITGQLWSRVVGITLAALSALANFVFLPRTTRSARCSSSRSTSSSSGRCASTTATLRPT
jgi:hypothetical protein